MASERGDRKQRDILCEQSTQEENFVPSSFLPGSSHDKNTYTQFVSMLSRLSINFPSQRPVLAISAALPLIPTVFPLDVYFQSMSPRKTETAWSKFFDFERFRQPQQAVSPGG